MRSTTPQLVSSPRIGLLTASLTLLCGCPLFSPDGPDRDPAEDCSGEGLPADADGLALVSVEIGRGLEDGAFTPYADGDDMKLFTGFQGAEMLTPDFRVDAPDDAPDELCLRVELRHESPEGAILDGGEYYEYLVFRRDDGGDGFTAGPMFDTLYQEGPGSQLQLRATVLGPDFAGEQAVTVILRR